MGPDQDLIIQEGDPLGRQVFQSEVLRLIRIEKRLSPEDAAVGMRRFPPPQGIRDHRRTLCVEND